MNAFVTISTEYRQRSYVMELLNILQILSHALLRYRLDCSDELITIAFSTYSSQTTLSIGLGSCSQALFEAIESIYCLNNSCSRALLFHSRVKMK